MKDIGGQINIQAKPEMAVQTILLFFRLSEMYLIRAEALHKGASISGVTELDDFNMIRTNRGLT